MADIVGVKVALSAAIYAIDRPYDYRVSADMADYIAPGMRVLVPFGAGNRRTEGLVLATTPALPQGIRVKDVLAVLDDAPVLDEAGIALAIWMRDRFFCTVYAAARAMLPAGLWFKLKERYAVVEGVERSAAYDFAGGNSDKERVLDVLWNNEGSAPLETIQVAFGGKTPTRALHQLVDGGIIQLETLASRGIRDKSEQVVALTIPAESAMALVEPKRKTAPLRYAVVELLCGIGSASSKEVCYFTGATSATIKSLEKSGIVTLERREVLRRVEVDDVKPAKPVVLNDEQQQAFEQLDGLAQQQNPAVALLYGVTGSGKTQVYIQLIRAALDRGETAMVLVPEIALTPQLLTIFTSHFGDQIAVLHSSLRTGERYDEWKRVRSGDARVVLGTRSAVFAPLQNLGLIILDEEQEGSYKSENTPRYHARDIAKYRCAKQGGLLVLGSATPAVETMYLARRGVYHMVTLTRRYNRRAMPSVLIADMKEELRQGNGTSIGALLHRELAANIERGEQSILFLNRRGASRMVSCRHCGEVPTCPRCSVRLTYHSANGRLMCHYCGFSQRLPDECPDCGGDLDFIGTGTQRIQSELEALFPDVPILRMDADTVTATRTHQVILNEFVKKKVPILIGTQMVAKGLDFENVTLVGVITADLALYVDSFRAGERTFSLLTQVVGRAGRGQREGRAVIQTYTPDNEVIRFAAGQDYDSFYETEVALRQMQNCPPFCDLYVLTASGMDEAAVMRACARLREGLAAWLKRPDYAGLEATLLGPAPASVAKINNRFYYRLTLRCQSNKALRTLLSHLLVTANQDKDNRGVSIFVDVNPYD